MTAEAAYQFLKPSLEQLTQEQKDELCRLISGKPEEKKTRKKKIDPVPSEDWYRRQLMKTWSKKKK